MKSSKLFTTLSTALFVIGLVVIAVYFIKSSDRNYDVKTAEWFEKNPAERKTIFIKCAEDKRELGENPNCINARHAIKSVSERE